MTRANSGFGRVSETRLKTAVDPQPLRDALRELVPSSLIKGELVVSLAGEIRQSAQLSDVVAWLAQSGRSGTLIVTTNEGVRALAIENGALLGAYTSVLSERIGELLQRTARVSSEEIDEASVMGAIDGRPVGEVLVEAGRIDVATRDSLLARRAEEIFYAALRVSEGLFCLVDSTCGLPALPGARPSLLALLMEAARRADEMAVFRELVGSFHHVPKRRDGAALPDDASAALRAVFDACDGNRTVEEVARECCLLEFEATEHVYQLAKKSLLEIAPPREGSSLEEALRTIADPFVREEPPQRRRSRSRRPRVQLAG